MQIDTQSWPFLAIYPGDEAFTTSLLRFVSWLAQVGIATSVGVMIVSAASVSGFGVTAVN